MPSSEFTDEKLRLFLDSTGAKPGRVIRPSRYSVTGYVSTTKGDESQESESSLEHDFYTLLEYDQRVARYFTQPFTICWTDGNGKRRKYTPDALVIYSQAAMDTDPRLKNTLFEVKPRIVLKEKWKELKPKLKVGFGWARDYGCNFHLVTEDEIRTPYLQNVKFLLGFRSEFLDERPDLVSERQALIKKSLFELNKTTPRELLEAISSDPIHQAELLPWLWNLINCRSIGVDLEQKMTMASPIWTLESQ